MVQTSATAERAYSYLMQRDLNSGILVTVGSMAAGFHEDVHPYVRLWNEERDRLAKVAKMAIDAGVAERQVKIAEAEGQEVYRIVEDAINACGLDVSVANAMRIAIANGMRQAA